MVVSPSLITTAKVIVISSVVALVTSKYIDSDCCVGGRFKPLIKVLASIIEALSPQVTSSGSGSVTWKTSREVCDDTFEAVVKNKHASLVSRRLEEVTNSGGISNFTIVTSLEPIDGP